MGWLSGLATPRMAEALLMPGMDMDISDAFNPASAYRPITSSKRDLRDLLPIEQERMIQIAAYMAMQNPMGKRICELLVDYLVGEGLSYHCANDEVVQVLDRFWHHSVNQLALKQFKKVWQLTIFGDQAYPAFVDRDGLVQLGYIDPMNVARVLADPNNAEVRTTLLQKSFQGYTPPPYDIIRVDEREGSPTKGMWVGGDRLPNGAVGTLWWTINNFSNATRGISDLLAMMDWLDLYDQFLMGEAKRAADMSNYIWDVTLKGMSPEQIKSWLQGNLPPDGPTIRAHNENVEWKVVERNFRAHDISEQARTIRGQIATAHGLPEGWLFSASESNRSTLAEQASPILKYLSRRQAEVKSMFRQMLEFVRDQAMLAGTLSKTLDEDAKKITVEASEVSTVDLGKVALTAKDIVAAATVSEDRSYLTHEEAGGAVRRVFNELGTELPPEVPEATVMADRVVKAGMPEEGVQAMVNAAEIGRTANALRQDVRARGVNANGNRRTRQPA